MLVSFIWTFCFLAGIGFFSWQLYGRWRPLWAARNDDGRNYSAATLPQRFVNVIVYALFQKKFFGKDQPAGVAHAIIFWGFLVLGLQIIQMFGRGWSSEFYFPLLIPLGLLGPYAATRDFFEIAVLIAVTLGLYRWNVSKPKRLMGILPAEKKLNAQSHFEASLILLFIATIMITGLIYDATREFLFSGTLGVEIEKSWAFASSLVAGFLPQETKTVEIISQASWWVHNLVVLVFLNLLPRSKHFHIITAIPNVFFGKVEEKGHLPKKDFEAENALFGRYLPSHFTRKQVLDMYSCTECGRCSSVCPAAATGKPLAPRQMLLNLRDAIYARQANPAQEEATVIRDDCVSDEVIWSCVACRACEQACPVNIEYVDKIIDMRQHLVQEAARFPEELNRAFKGMETHSNPWGISSEERMGWSQGLEVPTLEQNPKPEYLYYVGCGGSFDANNKKTTASFIKVLKAASVNFAVLGKSELCNGESARRLGNEYLFQTMATALTETINAAGVKKILVNCPHCFNTLRNEYPEFGGTWTVVHAAALVQDLIDQGRVKLECPSKQQKVVYHDSCYYGRFNDIYDEPRNLINKIPGAELDEMSACKESATCCGAGGGRMWMEEPKDQRVNIFRTNQALEKNPQTIATSCPFCKIMIDSAINEKGLAEKVRVRDVMELVSESL